MHGLLPCRLGGGAISSAGSVSGLHLGPRRSLCIVCDRFIVCPHTSGNNERLAITAAIVGCRVDDPDNIILPLSLIEQDLKEELC